MKYLVATYYKEKDDAATYARQAIEDEPWKQRQQTNPRYSQDLIVDRKLLRRIDDMRRDDLAAYFISRIGRGFSKSFPIEVSGDKIDIQHEVLDIIAPAEDRGNHIVNGVRQESPLDKIYRDTRAPIEAARAVLVIEDGKRRYIVTLGSADSPKAKTDDGYIVSVEETTVDELRPRVQAFKDVVLEDRALELEDGKRRESYERLYKSEFFNFMKDNNDYSPLSYFLTALNPTAPKQAANDIFIVKRAYDKYLLEKVNAERA